MPESMALPIIHYFIVQRLQIYMSSCVPTFFVVLAELEDLYDFLYLFALLETAFDLAFALPLSAGMINFCPGRNLLAEIFGLAFRISRYFSPFP